MSITGERGFIGQHLTKRLAAEKDHLPAPTHFHVAGKFSGGEMLASNIMYGARVLAEAKASGIQRFINAGTSWDARTLYGASKQAFECILDHYRVSGMQAITLKLSNVYGPEQKKLLLPLLIQASDTGTVFTIRSSADQPINFIYIDDVIDAFLLAARSSLNGPYTVYADEAVTMGEFIEVFREFRPLKVEWGTGATYALDNKNRLPGWSPKVSLREG